jgi:hypothetical protein
MLQLLTYRPEFEPPWVGRPYVTTLNLNRLGEREIAAIIDRVKGNKALSDSIIQDIIERTDGIPLFVEEMTKAVLEAEGAAESAVATCFKTGILILRAFRIWVAIMGHHKPLASVQEVNGKNGVHYQATPPGPIPSKGSAILQGIVARDYLINAEAIFLRSL